MTNCMKKQYLVTLLLCVAIVGLQTVEAWLTPNRLEDHAKLHDSWHKFKTHFKRSHATLEEEQTRFKIFSQNYQAIVDHNIKHAAGESSFFLGINEYSDLTEEEMGITKILNTDEHFKGSLEHKEKVNEDGLTQRNNPVSLDYRDVGAVSAVRNSNKSICANGDYAYAAVAGIEAAYFMMYGKLIYFSDQYIFDCLQMKNYIGGCSWGQPENALFSFLVSNGACLPTLYEYPGANGRINSTCNYKPWMCVATILGYKTPFSCTEPALLNMLVEQGPLIVKIDANWNNFRSYAGGVYDNPKCRGFMPSLAVLLVGYGKDAASGLDFWIVKNSWGTSWGEAGFIRMRRNVNMGNSLGLCGIGDYPRYVNVY